MGIRITVSGMHTTVQDLGREKFQRYGFSRSGAMDQLSLKLANLLVGNEKDEAGLEMMVTGSSFSFTYPNTVAVTGADCQPKLNGEPVKMYQALHVGKGDELTTGRIRGGVFSYIAFAGGLVIPKVMASHSTSTRFGIGGVKGRTLQTGDAMAFKNPDFSLRMEPARQMLDTGIENDGEKVTIRVIPTSQTELFTEQATASFFETDYTVSKKSDRMGYRLEGEKIETKGQQAVLSEATVLGDIQVPPDGQPIVLLADRQTTGGYPVIGTICTVDLPKFVQCYPGKKIQFSPVSLSEAQTFLKQQERFLEQLENELRNTGHLEDDVLEGESIKQNINNEEWHTENIKGLIRTVDESSLTFFSYEDENIRMKLDKQKLQPEEAVESCRSGNLSIPEPDSGYLETEIISSPLVGLFYIRPVKETAPFVKEGDRVRAEQVVGRIEAMNINYEIKAEVDGYVRSIQVSDGQMVEYGQPIMGVEIDKKE